jgi:hypothetical protein
MALKDIFSNPSKFNYYTDKGYPDTPTGNNTGFRGIKYGKDQPNGGSSGQPFIQIPLPPVDQQPDPLTNVDWLYRGDGLVTRSTATDVERISKFLATPQGLRFLSKQQTLQTLENLSLYGTAISKWRWNNPASYITNTALAPTGEHLKNIIQKTGNGAPSTSGTNFNFALPNFTREQVYGEANPGLAKASATPKLGTDKITILPLYASSSANLTTPDTVNFYITKISNDGNPANNVYIHFRSYIEGISDSFSADWGTQKYMGRGENFYFYNGFDRDISFSWKVPVLSSLEQQAVYTKLNYLASLMAPDYSDGGFMRGNIVKITIGDYLTDVPGVITSLGYSIDDNISWNIPRNDAGTIDNINQGYTLPQMITVGTFSFKPIHTFLPKTVNPKFVETGEGQYVDAPFINFGKLNGGTDSTGGFGSRPISPSTLNISQTNTNPEQQNPNVA